MPSRPAIQSFNYPAWLRGIQKLVALIFLYTVVPCWAQVPSVTDVTSTPRQGAGHNYIKSQIETVNPANGSVSLRLPISLPPGRGITTTFDLAYDTSGFQNIQQAGPSSMLWTPIPGDSSSAGFSEGGWVYPVPTLGINSRTKTLTGPPPYNDSFQCWIATDYLFQDMSGTRHSLGLSTNGILSGLPRDSCNSPLISTVTTAGEPPIAATTLNLGSPGTNQDGTAMPANLAPVTVTLPNGTTIYFDETGQPPVGTVASWIQDRYGNKVTIQTGSPSAVLSYIDTLGRTAISVSSFGSSTGDAISVAGLTQPYKVNWTTMSWNYTVNYQRSSQVGPTGPQTNKGSGAAVSSIVLPNGQAYQFQYDPTYGLVSKVIYPSGGYVRYVWNVTANAGNTSGLAEYGLFPDPSIGSDAAVLGQYDVPVVTDRYVSFDGSTEVLHQHFTYSTNWSSNSRWSSKTTTVTTTDMHSGSQTTVVYTYLSVGSPSQPNDIWQLAAQIPVEQTIQYEDSNKNVVRTVTKSWLDDRTLLSQQNTLETGKSSLTLWCYDSNEQVTGKYEYDFGTSAVSLPSSCTSIGGVPTGTTAGSLVRQTFTTYASSSAITAAHVIDRPATIEVEDGSGNRVAETDYAYDNPAGTTTSGIVQHSVGCNCGSMTKGTEWVNGTAKLSYSYTYDDTGQVLSKLEPNGAVTNYSYSNSNAYLSKVTHPTTNGVNHIEQFGYDSASGELMSSIDENNQTTTYAYNDALNRPTEVDYPNGGVTTNAYTDTPGSVKVETRSKIDSSRSTDSFVLYDGIGHPIAHSVANGQATPWNRTDTCYDGLGRIRFTSYPYQISSATAAPNCTTGIGDTTAYDALGRVLSVTHSDGTSLSTSYAGRATKVQDEGNGANRVTRISQLDGLGRLVSVCEVTSATQMGSKGTPSSCGQDINGTGFLTSYSYDTLGNPLSVTQTGMSSRSFSYDFLSRMLSTTNPESGKITYTYDSNSNCPTPNSFPGDLVSKVDARGIRSCVQYDALHRATQKNYSDGTPTVAYSYDQASAYGVNLSNTIGRQSSIGTAGPNSTGEIFSYDQVGHLVDNSQCTPQNCGTGLFPIQYQTDFIGDITSASNGLGTILSYSYDVAAGITGVTSSLSDANHPQTLASQIAYNAFGAPISISVGNAVGESLGYATRGWLDSETVTGVGAPGAGSVAVSGTEQSKSNPPTAGHGTVTISGTEQSFCPPLQAATTTASTVSTNNTGSCPDPLTYDSGTISITVNGWTATASYGQNSTASGLASTLTSTFNSNNNSPVTATVSGAVITLTSKATGASSNYSLSSDSVTNDPTDFASPSFSGSPSGSTLTGGNNTTTTYDSGTVSITVNGFGESVSYGQGSTPSSIASALASAFNGAGSSPVTASASAGTVALTSKTTGTASNYIFSSSSSGSFSPASFSTSNSGANLTGGTNATGTAYALTIPTSGGFAPDGDVLQANDSVNGNWTYSYDDFNRLSSSSCSSHCPDGQSTQGFGYKYDQYGNRWQQNLTAGSGGTSSLTFSGSNNRIDGYSYDASGNLLNDGQHTYFYDAENRIIQVDGSAGYCATHSGTAATACYVYDGEGERVRKTTGSTSVDYLYDAAGHQITEVSSIGAWNRGEIYAGGRHLATYANSTTYFNHIDWLGTERARTSMAATVCETVTNVAFGDGQATSGTCGDTSPMHFTGKQRDTETNLDDFGARYYTSQMGRWVTPDWSARAEAVPYASLGNPQTLNLYAYVNNNPTTLVDADGHAVQPSNDFAQTMEMQGDSGVDEFADTSAQSGDAPADPTLDVQKPIATAPDPEALAAEVTPIIPAETEELASLKMPQPEAQQQTTGPYIADLKSKEIAPLLDPNHKPSKSDVVGPNGECVDLTKKFSGMGDVSARAQWRAGSKVVGNKDIKPGTAIATFNDKGRYPSAHGWNSGIYLNKGVNGSIWILDQWPGHTPMPREVLLDNSRAPADNSAAYSVIQVVPR